MPQVTGTAHTGFIVKDLEKTKDFWINTLSGKLLVDKTIEGDTLGSGVLGENAQPYAKMKQAVVEIGGGEVEFFQFLTPVGKIPFHGDNSIPGSAHLALKVDDLQAMYDELVEKGVEFNSVVNEAVEGGKVVLKWVFCRDPDNRCLELMEC